ncbi:RNA polymerase sigma factor [Filimonas lacunae]|nr:hypothetical protein [Filimonas lacunae]BAV07138.1 hypothetical protein FLA_3161 [Filimonas lacunae]
MDYVALDDISLVKRIYHNDEKAFTELFNRYWLSLYNTAYGILRYTHKRP